MDRDTQHLDTYPVAAYSSGVIGPRHTVVFRVSSTHTAPSTPFVITPCLLGDTPAPPSSVERLRFDAYAYA